MTAVRRSAVSLFMAPSMLERSSNVKGIPRRGKVLLRVLLGYDTLDRPCHCHVATYDTANLRPIIRLADPNNPEIITIDRTSNRYTPKPLAIRRSHTHGCASTDLPHRSLQ